MPCFPDVHLPEYPTAAEVSTVLSCSSSSFSTVGCPAVDCSISTQSHTIRPPAEFSRNPMKLRDWEFTSAPSTCTNCIRVEGVLGLRSLSCPHYLSSLLPMSLTRWRQKLKFLQRNIAPRTSKTIEADSTQGSFYQVWCLSLCLSFPPSFPPSFPFLFLQIHFLF